MQESSAEKLAAVVQDDQKTYDGDRLTSPIFIVSARDGPNNKKYAVHEDILKQSKVLARMCDGDFKEAYERRIVLPEDDPIDVGILVEYLYTRKFWVHGNPQIGASKQESATRLAHLYIFADKYDLEQMKVLITAKIAKYTNVAAPDDWLAVAEVIYAATPDSDVVYPKFLRSLVVHFMKVEQAKPNGCADALQKEIEKGGRLAVHIYEGSRIHSARREEKWLDAWKYAGILLYGQECTHSQEHDDCGECYKDETYRWYPNDSQLRDKGLHRPEQYCHDIVIDEEKWEDDYDVGGELK
ncbi:MAG: hypothetical protein Q9188_000687 [Gyalolechia gomerana]